MSRSFPSPKASLLFLVLTLLSGAGNLFGQGYVNGTGVPTFTTSLPVEAGFINVANGNLHIEIPIASMAQRGSLPLNEKLVYDSRIWQAVNNGTSNTWQPTNVPNSMLGWRFVSGAETGAVTQLQTHTACGFAGYNDYTSFTWTEPDGTEHMFPIHTETTGGTGCGSDTPSDTQMAADATGYIMKVTNYTQATVIAPDGTQVFPTWKDTNGNSFSTDGSGNLVDTLGRTPVSYSTNGTSQNYYDVLTSAGTTQRVTVNYAGVTVSTAFGQSGVTEFPAQSVNAYQSVSLPDGSSYQFGYDSYGELSSLTLPTGGQITLTYTNFTDVYGNVNRWVNTRVSGGGTWTYAPAIVANTNCTAIQSGTIDGCQQVTVTKPSNDKIVYTFSMNGGAWNNQAQFLNSSGTVMATTQQVVDLSNTCSQCSGAAYVTSQTSYTILPSVGGQNLTKKTQYTYDSMFSANLTSAKEWNFYTGTPSANPDRETDISYLNTAPYESANILNRPLSVTKYAGACCSSMVAQTNYTYDSTAITSIAGITHHDDANYGSGNTVRGNVTQVQQWISGTTFWTTTKTYDSTGQLRQLQDNKGNITSYDYTDHFYNDNGANPPSATTPPNGPTNAFATTVTVPIVGAQTANFYLGSGKPAFATDQNGATSYMHYNDSLDRPTQAKDPIGGWKQIAYTSPTQLDTYIGLTDITPSTGCTSCRHDQVLRDNLGRVTNNALVNDPDGQINTVTSYDTTGRVSGKTNPYRTTSDPTYGSSSLTYDGLGRTIKVTRPDANFGTYTFGAALSSASSICGVTAYPSVTTDEAGNQRQYWTDGFGRLVEVDERDSGGAFSIATCYVYDALDNLSSATQRGGTTDTGQWRVRSYQYDGLSRQTQATTPEAGTETVSFTSSGSSCSGDPSLPCSGTDGRLVTTNYTYDALNRLTGKTYSDTTPAVSYFYDQTSYNGLTITNGKGRRTGMSDGSGETAWSFDADGHVLTKRQTISGVTNSIAYTYNLNGSIASIKYPSGKTYTYGYSNAMRAISLQDIPDAIPYVQNAQYAAPGMLTSATEGTHRGFTVSNSFNNRLQPTVLSATSPTLTLMSMSYNWTLPNGKNNGSIYQIQNNRDTTRSLQYGYDQLNRLTSAKTYNVTTWGDSYLYDNWGNLLQKNVTQGTGETLQLTVDAHNHVSGSGFTYDAAGDLTWDTFNSMKFDAENRATPTSGGSYLYDGDGHRVKKVSGSSTYYYWFDDNFNVLATTGANVRDYVYFNGSRIAFFAGTLPYFYVNDNLGSASVIANGDGSVIEWESDYYPFGGQRVITNSITNYFWFTGYQYDSGTGYYYADNREESPNLGRFMSPDPDAGDLANPQSLNRYAYVINNPTNAVDPDGQKAIMPGWEFGGAGGFSAASAYLGTLASDPTGTFGSSWNEFDGLQKALTPTITVISGGTQTGTAYFQGAPIGGSSEATPPTLVISYPNIGLLSFEGSSQSSQTDPTGSRITIPEPRENGGWPSYVCSAGFIKASNNAWSRAGLGTYKQEAGFWIVDTPSGQSFQDLPNTNESGTITGLRVPEGAIGLVHTHPNSMGAAPSSGDITNSNKVNIPFFVLSNRGLWVHDPGEKGSRVLRQGLNWQKPCR